MGASLAIMYTAKYPREVFSLVLDTPFRYLKKVVSNVAEHNSGSVPKFIISIVVYFVEKRTESLVGSDIFANDFSQWLENIVISILILEYTIAICLQYKRYSR